MSHDSPATGVAQVLDCKPNPARPGMHLTVIRCPFCGGKHTHGVSQEEVRNGAHRLAHCVDLTERKGMRRKTRECLAEARRLREVFGSAYLIPGVKL